MGPVRIDLSAAVHDKAGGEVAAVELRRPTGRDILEIGYPYAVTRNPRSGETTEVVDTARMLPLIARCADLPISAVEHMVAVDVFQCVEAIRLFFHYRTPLPSSPNTSPPGDGAAIAPSSSA